MNNFSLAQLLALFDIQSRVVSERFDEVKLVFQIAAHKSIEFPDFTDAIQFLNPRDKLLLSVSIEDGDPFDYYSGSDATEFLQEYKERMSIVENETVEVTLQITKDLQIGVISVYLYEEFLKFLKGLTLQVVYQEFYTYFQKAHFLILELQANGPEAKTQTIWFVNKGYTGTPSILDRQSILDKGKSACNFNLSTRSSLVAEDFWLTENNDVGLAELFDPMATFLAVAFLYDISTVQANNLDFRLNGYKSMNGHIDTSIKDPNPLNPYFSIYQWVYGSGNFIDKIGLARNIISLHLENTGAIGLKGDAFLSIQSSYKVYEKQNIKQYIEIRNKISDQLLSFHDRANKIIENFAAGFQKSAFALITFYISAIILKVLNKNKLVDVFTIDTAILSTSFIACSVIYYFVQKWEVNAQRIRFENNYQDVKARYTDLLDAQDIDRIMNNDHEFNSDLTFIKTKGKIYSIMWFAFLGIFLATTWLLYFIYNPSVMEKIGGLFTNDCLSYCR